MKSYLLFQPDQIVEKSTLNDLGVVVFHVPLVNGDWENNDELSKIRKDRGYTSHDVVDIEKSKFSSEQLARFFEEHLHEDEEVRFVLEGCGFFDVRDKFDRWVRILVEKNDLLVIPPGIYHRFTLADYDTIKVLRLFQTAPKWMRLERSVEAEKSDCRRKYLETYSPYTNISGRCSDDNAASSSSSTVSGNGVQGPNGVSFVAGDRAASYAHYPHVRKAGGFIYVSGCSSRRSDNTHVGATQNDDGTWTLDIAQQTRAVIQNIDVLLQKVGAGLKHLVDVTVFLVDMKHYKDMNKVYNDYFDKDTGPTRTCVAVHQLPHPNLLIEIKAIAVDAQCK